MKLNNAPSPEVVAVNGTVVAQGTPFDVFTPGTLRKVYGADLTVIHQDGMVVIADAPHGFREALRSSPTEAREALVTAGSLPLDGRRPR